jgi:N-carbamoyl-L-amino-acid hydrolase
MDLADLRINADRFRRDFDELSCIGSTAEGGVNRPALSPAHLEARAWFRKRCARAGFEFSVDGAGNHSARLNCAPESRRILMLGSHLDSVPKGGRFDGALGVAAALEVLETVREAGLKLDVNLEAIDFTDEEGTHISLLGSQALAGRLTLESLRSSRGGRESLEAGMARTGLTYESILSTRRDPANIVGYLEMHIEQGQKLAQLRRQIGIVKGIVGVYSYWLTFKGQASHAGSTPMVWRKDASLGASAFTLAARELVMKEFPNGVVNVGIMQFKPGVFNIVPGAVDAALEFREIDTGRLEELRTRLLAEAKADAERFGLTFTYQPRGHVPPALMDERVRTALHDAADGLGLSQIDTVSGAFHDALSMATICPSGIFFVPSQANGISHDPLEFTEWDDCVRGANVLLQAALQLAE